MSGWSAAHHNIEEALSITQHDRNSKNGDHEDNFSRIALCWTAMLSDKLTADVSAADVARMMVVMKMCRDAHEPNNDNRVDGHGYLLCLDRTEPVGEEA